MPTSETVHALREAADSSALNPLHPKDLISTFGVIGVWFVLFAETGLLVGFFLPGDSLLFLAGVAASGVGERLVGEALSLPALLIGSPICAIIGAQLGHFLGVKLGRPMFDRPESRLFKRTYVEKAEHYFNKFGPAKAVVLARFIPIVRTFLNPLAGVLEMPARTFLLWNVIGAVLWTDGIILAGYYLGDSIPAEAVDRYLLPVIALVILISVLPILIEVTRELSAKRRLRGP
ncbi:MAG: DedA family protein, partial [Mycobacteriales bacterium]